MNVYNQIKKDFIWIAIIFTLLLQLVNWFQVGYDDTDNHETNTRSGLALHIDYGTGCHYLSNQNSLIPRVDDLGNHICKR